MATEIDGVLIEWGVRDDGLITVFDDEASARAEARDYYGEVMQRTVSPWRRDPTQEG